MSAFAGISNITELETSHKEADTKIILHEMHLREAHNVNVTFFSLSGVTDIIVLLVAFLQDHKEHILTIDGHGVWLFICCNYVEKKYFFFEKIFF